MATQTPKNILIAPLDWGLGHTSRCVPLIRYLTEQGHHPVFAGNVSQRSFIAATFNATINTVHLDGYNITYSKWNKVAQLGLLAQLPGISSVIGNEHNWLKQKAAELQLHGVISDNRYGLFHKQIPSVIITHQLRVLTGLGNIMDRGVQRLHYKYLERFNSVWVPDIEGVPNLGSKLSHPAVAAKGTRYIGLLSRFGMLPEGELRPGKFLIVILLSGPEPQRTNLSRILWQQALNYNGELVFIEGSDIAVVPSFIPQHITYHKRLTDEQLAPILDAAGMVICRSGYSTIMDLVAMHKKAVLIPTPGQTEQEYLASHLQEQGVFYSARQSGFNMAQAINEAAQFPHNRISLQQDYNHYKPVLDDWLLSL